MAYVIGIKMQEYDGSITEGLYCFGAYGTKGICTPETKDLAQRKVLVFEDLAEAQDYVKFLSKNYSYEFKRRCRIQNLKRENFGYYLLKTNTPKFKFKFGRKGEKSIAYKSATFYYLK
jgi:hypothetical protein